MTLMHVGSREKATIITFRANRLDDESMYEVSDEDQL